MKIWIDVLNVPHVHFFKPIVEELYENNDLIFTVREFAETIKLFEKKIDLPYTVIGTHKGANRLFKAFGSLTRLSQLFKVVPEFDLRLSLAGDFSSYYPPIKRKKQILFCDNEIAPHFLYSRFIDYSFWPKSISKEILMKQGFHSESIIQYNGYKEDIYLADFNPNPKFINTLPFDNYYLVRPENIMANYVDGKESISPKILELLVQSGQNIVYLPRYDIDKEYASGMNPKQIYIPNEPINGLDAVYYSKGVLTGAGTFAREASAIGVPAVSYFAGSKLLSVDKSLIDENRLFYTRDPQIAVEKILNSPKPDGLPDLTRLKEVKKELMEKLAGVIASL